MPPYENLEPFTVSVYTVLGKLVAKFQLKPNARTIPLHNLSSGLYILQLDTKDNVFITKIIKQ